MGVLVLGGHDNTAIRSATLNAVTAATKLDADVHVLIAGKGCEAAAKAAAQIKGVTKVLRADDARYDRQLAEPMAALIASIGKSYKAVLAAADTFGKNILPRAAALLDVAQISDIVAVVAGDTFVRPIYAGNAMATVQSSDAIKVITVRTTAFPAAPATGGAAAVDNVTAAADPALSSFVRQELSKSERPELTSAKIVISGGRGMQSGENFKKYLEPVADVLGAAVGASRAAVDSGFVPNDYQVGQTGKIVAPDLYVAIGISGAIQHLAGMKDSKVIVAINKDEEAPIFQVADYGLVGDLFKIVPDFEAELKRRAAK
jgi:electron transfer flavoprotein alpha subunit